MADRSHPAAGRDGDRVARLDLCRRRVARRRRAGASPTPSAFAFVPAASGADEPHSARPSPSPLCGAIEEPRRRPAIRRPRDDLPGPIGRTGADLPPPPRFQRSRGSPRCWPRTRTSTCGASPGRRTALAGRSCTPTCWWRLTRAWTFTVSATGSCDHVRGRCGDGLRRAGRRRWGERRRQHPRRRPGDRRGARAGSRVLPASRDRGRGSPRGGAVQLMMAGPSACSGCTTTLLRLWILGGGTWTIDPAEGNATKLDEDALPVLWAPEGERRIRLGADGDKTKLQRRRPIRRCGSPRPPSPAGSATCAGRLAVTRSCSRSVGRPRAAASSRTSTSGTSTTSTPMMITNTGAGFGAEWRGSQARWEED